MRCALCGREDVQARSLDHHTQEVCARRSVEARFEELETKFAKLCGRVAAGGNLAEVERQISEEMLAEARAREIAWADAREARQWEVVRVIGCHGTGYSQFTHPRGVAIDREGRIFVTDTNNHRIQVFSRDGTFVSQFGGPGDPIGVSVDPQGHITVADFASHRIQVFSRDGTFLSQFGSHGIGPGQLTNPLGVAVDQQGRIIVADTDNNRIQVFSHDGTFLSKFGEKGDRDGQFKLPGYLAVDQAGRIIVSEYQGHRLQVIRMPRVFDAYA